MSADPSRPAKSPAVRMSATGVLVALALVALLPLALAPFPPSSDLYQWIFQGAIISDLVRGGGPPNLTAAYSFLPGPVPNLGAALGIGLLCSILSPAAAGRVYFAICVLGVGLGFAYLSRGAQGRASALEPLGFVWAYGWFAYSGYLSNELAVGLALFTVGRLLRIRGPERAGPTRSDLLWLGGLGLLTYFAHLIGWAVICMAIAVQTLSWMRRGHWRAAAALAATQTPAAALLVWYAAVRPGGGPTSLSWGLLDKLGMLGESLTFFLRADPFTFPIGLARLDLALAVLLVVVLAWNVKPTGNAGFRPLALASGAALVIFSLGIPVRTLGEAIHPDQRLMFAGSLVLLAGLPLRPWRPLRGSAVALFVGSILALHTVEYARFSAELAEIHRGLEQVVAPEDEVLCLNLRRPHEAQNCQAGGAFPPGTATLKWFGLMPAVTRGVRVGRIATTSILLYRGGYDGPVPVWLSNVAPDDGIGRILRNDPTDYDAVVLLGCPGDIAEMEERMGAVFETQRRGRWYAVKRSVAPRPRAR